MPDIKDLRADDSVARGAANPDQVIDSVSEDVKEEPADATTTGVLDPADHPLADPFFWPEDVATPAHAAQREAINEIMARAMRWRSVEANGIITKPADIQRYVETCWIEALPAAQAAHAALEAAGYAIVRDNR
jgi:hypothetical protein